MTRHAAIIGLGTRGCSWVETCLSAGWALRGFDPEPDVSVTPARDWRREETISAAVQGADWVLCCLPERLELVHMVLKRVQAAAPGTAIIAVVSAVHDIESLQAGTVRPGQITLLTEAEDGGLALDFSERNAPQMRADAKALLAELAAVRSLSLGRGTGFQPRDAESA